jgi:hypothetical protein
MPIAMFDLGRLFLLQSIGAVGLILRLVPHMRASTTARALGDVATMLKVRSFSVAFTPKMHTISFPFSQSITLRLSSCICKIGAHSCLERSCF